MHELNPEKTWMGRDMQMQLKRETCHTQCSFRLLRWERSSRLNAQPAFSNIEDKAPTRSFVSRTPSQPNRRKPHNPNYHHTLKNSKYFVHVNKTYQHSKTHGNCNLARTTVANCTSSKKAFHKPRSPTSCVWQPDAVFVRKSHCCDGHHRLSVNQILRGKNSIARTPSGTYLSGEVCEVFCTRA